MKKIYKFLKIKKIKAIVKKRAINILWYPCISSREDLNREIARLYWYFHPFVEIIDNIVFSIDDTLLKNNNFSLTSYVDPKILDFEESFTNKINFTTNELLEDKVFDMVVYWSDSSDKVNIKNNFPFNLNAKLDINQFEANQMANISSIFLTKNYILENNAKLNKILIKLKSKKYENVCLFGSGPSLVEYKKNDYTDTLSIICNSLVKNKKFLLDIRPKIIIATDAVFHSGYSLYASEFRKSLYEALDLIEEMIFIFPLRDLSLYTHNIPKRFRNRIFAIKREKSKKFNFNLIENSYVKSTSNVLTVVMLPLAATLSNNIRILGFDGKENIEEEKFWDYSEEFQFNNTLNSTFYAHPSFYKVKYQDYYNIHCKEVDEMIKKLTGINIKVRSLAPSYIPALKSSYD